MSVGARKIRRIITLTVCLGLMMGCTSIPIPERQSVANEARRDADFHLMGEQVVLRRGWGHTGDALVILREMEALRPDHAGTQFALGEVLGTAGPAYDSGDAIDALNNFLRLAKGGMYLEVSRRQAYEATRTLAREYIAILEQGWAIGGTEPELNTIDPNGWGATVIPKRIPSIQTKVQLTGRPVTLDLGAGVGMVFNWIPPGHSIMGSERGESDELPVRIIELTEGFWMGIHEVTQVQWRQLMNMAPSSFQGDRRPVEQVSWSDAKAFCRVLTLRTASQGIEARLPTELEWEYACRAGGDEERYAALHLSAWYTDNSLDATHDVGGLLPNARGLYDMYGNVWEWCQDWYAETSYTSTGSGRDSTGSQNGQQRVLRGGSWDDDEKDCRSASRMGINASSRFNTLGFRVVLSAR